MTTTTRRPHGVTATTPVRESLAILSDAELVKKCLNGSKEEGWVEIYSRYQQRIFTFIWKKIGDSDRAEELVQHAFMKIFRNLWKFDPSKATFSTWLHGAALNLVKNEYRDRARKPSIPFSQLNDSIGFEENWTVSHNSDPEQNLERKRAQKLARQAIEAALAGLAKEQRETFILMHIEELTYEEISLLTGAPVGTVKSRGCRARDHVHRTLLGHTQRPRMNRGVKTPRPKRKCQA